MSGFSTITSAANVVVVRTGVANTASVIAALARCGAAATLSTDADVIAAASHVVLPGVGSFGQAMDAIHGHSLSRPLVVRIANLRPTLCICLGMQLLCEGSEESPGVRGLGVIPGVVTKFRSGRVPQLGWNRVEGPKSGKFLRNDQFYFANSFKLDEQPPGWASARTDYHGGFVSAIERGGVLACQFHPELSGAAGLGLIERWLHAGPPDVLPHESSQQVDGVSSRGGPASLDTRIIPCLDVRNGRVVKGVRFQGLRDAGDPAERAAFYESQGADELVILDVAATTEERQNQAQTVREVRRVLSIPLTVGGGIRSIEDAARVLDAGADKVSVNSAAVLDPTLISAISGRFGSQCAVLALDAARRGNSADQWEVVTRSGQQRTGIDAIAWACEAARLGAGEILLTSWDRDGTGDGYDLKLISRIAQAVAIPVIASGGAANAQHLVEAVRAGASAVLAASIFHDNAHSVGDVKRSMSAAGIQVRLPREQRGDNE